MFKLFGGMEGGDIMTKGKIVLYACAILGISVFLSGCGRGVKLLSCNITSNTVDINITADAHGKLSATPSSISACDIVTIHNSTNELIKAQLQIFGNDGVYVGQTTSDIPAGSTIGPIKEIIDPGAQQIRLYIKNNNDIFRVSVAFPSAQ